MSFPPQLCPFTVTEDCNAKGETEIDVRKGQVGIYLSQAGEFYADVRIFDPDTGSTIATGKTAERCLQLGTDWPFVATKLWEPTDAEKEKDNTRTSVKAGEEGKVVRIDRSGWARVSFPKRDSGSAVVTISLHAITIGNRKKYGHWKYNNRNEYMLSVRNFFLLLFSNFGRMCRALVDILGSSTAFNCSFALISKEFKLCTPIATDQIQRACSYLYGALIDFQVYSYCAWN
jgi:hypothetical protein